MMICVPINKKRTKNLLVILKAAGKIADLIEIWFDEIRDLDNQNLQKIFTLAKKPLIYKVTRNNRNNIKLLIKSPKVNYIDLDINTNDSLIQKIKKLNPQIKIILSYHNFQKTPQITELKKIVKKMLKKGADIIKIATQAKTYQDSLMMLGFLSQISVNKLQAICLCMGKHGEITRLTGHLFGNYLMYAPMRVAHKTAPGQITVHELQKILRSIN